MTYVIRKEAARECGSGPKGVYNYEEGGEMKEVETRRSLECREECLRWKLSVPRVGPIAGPLTAPSSMSPTSILHEENTLSMHVN